MISDEPIPTEPDAVACSRASEHHLMESCGSCGHKRLPTDPHAAAPDTPDDYIWRVTNRDGDVTVEMGTSMAGTSLVVYLGMGRALIKLGQRFLENVGSTNHDDE